MRAISLHIESPLYHLDTQKVKTVQNFKVECRLLMGVLKQGTQRYIFIFKYE